MQFSIGGYLASGVQVQMSTNLASWQTAQTYSAGTNLMIFNTDTTQAREQIFQGPAIKPRLPALFNPRFRQLFPPLAGICLPCIFLTPSPE